MSLNTRSKTTRRTAGGLQMDSGNAELRSTARQKKVFSSPDSPNGGLALHESFNKIGIQDDPPGYVKNFAVSDSLKKNGTSCVVTASPHSKNKVMAPRSEEYPLKLSEKDLHEKPDNAEDMKLTTNVALDLLDQLVADYPVNPPLELRAGDSESVWNGQCQDPQSQSMASESHLSGTQTFPTAGQTFPQKQPILYKETADHCSFIDGFFLDPTVGYQVENTDQALQEYPKAINVDAELLEYLMGDNSGGEAGQEVTCGDLLSIIPQDTCVLNDIIYGTDKALEELATNHENELLKSGVHGVYTEQRFEVLKTQDSSSVRSELLGRGSFGVAIKYTVSEGFVFVKKKVTKNFHPEEVMFTHNNTHPNIIKSYALMLSHGTPEIIMEYAGQSLLSLLNERKTLSENTIWSLSWELCSGLAFLDTKNVVHFDIKPENIFIMGDGDEGYSLKIGDFGSARMPGGPVEMTAWTPEYLAPEMGQLFLRKNIHAKILKIQKTEQEIERSLQPKTDVFPAGLVVGFMYTGEHLLLNYIRRTKPDINESQQRLAVIGHVSHQEDLGVTLIPDSAGPEMKAVLTGMLQFDVNKRSSAEETRKLMTELSLEKSHVTNSATQMDVKSQPLNIPANSETGDGMEKKILPKKIKARTRQSRSKNEPRPMEFQMTKLSTKGEEIMNENEQLRKRMVRNELKRKLETRTPKPAAKIMKTVEAKQESMVLSCSGSGEGYQWESSQGNQSEISEESQRGFAEEYVPMEQPFPEIRISEHQHPICQAEDDWCIQETAPGNLPAVAPGNIPDFGCLGID